MAIDDLAHLKGELPEVFEDKKLPPAWEEDWLFIPIDEPEASAIFADASTVAPPDWSAESDSVVDLAPVFNRGGNVIADLPTGVPIFDSSGGFAGVPQGSGWNSAMPPPDAFAFYLPFHFFYPTWWGVYIILENALVLADYVASRSDGRIDRREALVAVRIFLYAHEAFHHIVESFATRLEVTHRVPLFRVGFNDYYGRIVGSDDCIEEALATAHGYRRVKEKFSPDDVTKRDAALEGLRSFIDQCPPGYRRAPEFFKTAAFEGTRNELAEINQRESLGNKPSKKASLWSCFPHAFSGIGRVTSKVNYVVRRDSRLANRFDLNLRYLRYRELRDRLQTVARCKPVREGHGSHEIWQAPDGTKFPVPRHPGDIHRGLLASIIKQSGVRMSLSQFLGSVA